MSKALSLKIILSIALALLIILLIIKYPVLQYSLYYLILVLVLFFSGYSTIISYSGIRKFKPLEIKPAKNKFAITVAAHNEENVIGSLIDNLKKLNYPTDLYDIFVICDNCSDQTANIVREKGLTPYERFNDVDKGKGHALKWMFNKLWDLEEKGQKYDAILVLDADNLVDRNFLNIMNTKLLNGSDVIQGYLDSKNPKDSWVTKSYAFSYWSTNRIWQLSRENLGLSAQVGGTGFVVRTETLKEIGWNALSLTEDLEFTQQYILKTGGRVSWAHEAKIYDEKPVSFIASWKQRVRWMQGHADCMTRLTGPILKEAFKKKSLLHFDSALYLLQPSRMVLSVLLILFGILSVLNLLNVEVDLIKPLYNLAKHSTVAIDILVITVFVLYYFINILGLILDKHIKEVWWVFYSYIFGISWLPINIIGILKKNNKEWSHTVHTRSIDINEIVDKTKK